MDVAILPSEFSIPEGWRFPLLTFAAMLALAALDFAGALFAKEWADRGHYVLLIGGVVSFTALFVVYARILKVAELSVVTLGWVIFLQVGILALDRLRYGVTMPWQKWAAIVVILALQAYLIAGRPGGNPNREPVAGGPTSAGHG
jgi:hypothetical protein